MPVDNIYMISLETTAVANGDAVTATSTLTVYTRPEAIVSAQVSLARDVSFFFLIPGSFRDVMSSVASIRRVSIRGFGNLELSGLPSTVTWSGLESITFELTVTSMSTVTNVATILIAESSV